MPLQLIPLVAGGVVLLIGVIGAAMLARKLAGKRVAILGRQRVGKSTILHLLQHGKIPEASEVSETVDPAQGGHFKLEIGGKAVDFAVPEDVPGNDGLAYADWKKAFTGADYLWYLFRSDLIALGDDAESQLVDEHLTMFKTWIDDAGAHVPRIILIGTHADMDPGFRKNASTFAKKVIAAHPIKIGQVMLNNAGVIVGSLFENDDAKKLINSLRSRL